MFHLRTIKSLKCHTCELSYEFLHDLHHGQKNNEQIYICKKCQCLQLMVDCEVISLLCIAYQGIWNAQFMFGIKIMDK
jgi:hypothetical protein